LSYLTIVTNHTSTELVIEAGRTERQYWKDLWRYRELFYFLAWRDILVRYKQTVIGLAWALIRPFLTMVVFTVVFGQLAKLPSEGAPYPILVFSGMLPWQFFASALAECSNSLISNANLISKVYFPAIDCTCQCSDRQFCGFPGFWHDFTGVNGLVQFCPQLAYPNATVIYRHCFCRIDGRWFMVSGAECEIPRLSLYCAVYRAVGLVYFAGWV
jgi:hypothetical protein